MLRWLKSLSGRSTAQDARADARDAVPPAAAGERIEDLMREAYRLHQSGDLSAAEDAYRRILAEQPENVDALYLRGEIAHRTGRLDAAIEWFGKAAALRPGEALFHQELAGALQAAGANAGAAEHYRRVLEIEPQNLDARTGLGVVQLEMGDAAAAAATFRVLVEADPRSLGGQVNLGSALLAQRQYAAAAECFEAALRIDPHCVAALSNLGGLRIKQGDYDAAQKLITQALQLDPMFMEARMNLGIVLLKQYRHEEALPIFEDAVRLKPTLALGHYNLGRVYRQAGKLERAIECHREALRLAPDMAEFQLDLGMNLLETGQVHEALALYRQAVAREPELSLCHLRLGHALETLGEFDQAMACYDRAIELEPDAVQAHVNRAALRLLRGDFAGGWPEYEWRLREPMHAPIYGRFPQPMWDGSPLQGRSLLVYAEQGVGDEIMYASCLPELIARGERCVIDCNPRLASLFRRSFPGATVHAGIQTVTPGWVRKGEPVDLRLPIASLPLYLRRSAADFPRHQGYLKPDPARVEARRRRLDALGPGLKVGLSWRGGVPKTGRAMRSLSLEQLLPVLRLEGIHFVSLQYDEYRPELQELRHRHGVEIHDWPDAIADLEETAALQCALDLTLTVCTAAAHMAGALGRPVWIMAPVKPEARYGLSGDTMPWYPSARLFRQAVFGDWSGVVAQVAASLADLRR